MFAVAEALMLYTHAWGIFYGAGAVIALIPIYHASDDKRALLRDAIMAFGGAGILFLPWLPNFIYQSTHTGRRGRRPRGSAHRSCSRAICSAATGSRSGWHAAAIVGVGALFTKRYRRTTDATMLWVLIVLPFATLALAWIASQITPAFVSRYFAPVLAPMFLLAAWGCARSGIVGLVAIVLSMVFVVHVASYTPEYKSDMRDVAAEIGPMMHKGDLVIVGQPEQVPLAWYYLPSGLRYANTLGKVADPRYMNWVYALKRLRKANPAATLAPLLASVKPGQERAFVRPLTEGVKNWEASWTQLVRRRSAQWGALLASDPNLKEIAWAPHDYEGACCVADSAVLYKKVS